MVKLNMETQAHTLLEGINADANTYPVRGYTHPVRGGMQVHIRFVHQVHTGHLLPKGPAAGMCSLLPCIF